jgi:hypothetical protein
MKLFIRGITCNAFGLVDYYVTHFPNQFPLGRAIRLSANNFDSHVHRRKIILQRLVKFIIKEGQRELNDVVENRDVMPFTEDRKDREVRERNVFASN